MTVIEVDFVNERRKREIHHIAIAQSVVELNAEPAEWGPTTAADLIGCENECWQDNEAAIDSLYRHAVTYVNTLLGKALRLDLADDPICHMRVFRWARLYLQEINDSFGLKLGEDLL